MAQLRAALARYPADSAVTGLVGELAAAGRDFAGSGNGRTGRPHRRSRRPSAIRPWGR
ncbi:hypothetical protein [Streptomyces misionensis]|uniref:MmyB family transcriptional regulator n=1 Tax=Streptomyces misionensis TaxID=67331 RepID=UPI003F4B61A3